MKFVIAFAFIFAVAVAAPASEDRDATIVEQNSDIDPQGNFQFS